LWIDPAASNQASEHQRGCIIHAHVHRGKREGCERPRNRGKLCQHLLLGRDVPNGIDGYPFIGKHTISKTAQSFST
jgi:hypothetical protein